jgi:pimeloyl-ACP methyl ester carboxylesterase
MNAFNHTSGKYYSIDGANIYYEITGNKEGPVILLLHGGCGSMEDFTPVLPMLPDQYSVIGVDSRGHGKSTMGNAKLTYERIQKDVKGLYNTCRLKN